MTHAVTLALWRSIEAILGSAGGDIEAAKYDAEDRDDLQEFESEIVHYEVVSEA